MLQSNKENIPLSMMKKEKNDKKKEKWQPRSPKNEKKREISYQKRSISYSLHTPYIYPHTCTSWYGCMTSFLHLYPIFDFAKYVMQLYLMIPYLELHKNLLDGRMKEAVQIYLSVIRENLSRSWKSYALFWKLGQKPKCGKEGISDDSSQCYSDSQPPKMTW